MQPSIGFINHIVPTNLNAANEIFKNVRTIYPDAPYVNITDGMIHHSILNKYDFFGAYKTNMFYSAVKLGYPPYDKNKVLSFIERIYKALEKYYMMNTDYFVHLEDDCRLFWKLTIDPKWEIAGHNIIEGNHIDKNTLKICRGFSKIDLQPTQYGAGGGTIYNTKTFIRNYHNVMCFIQDHWEEIERYQWPSCGYLDCFMVIYYLLCGKSYSKNTNILNIFPVDNDTPPDVLEKMYSKKYELVHNWKYWYN